MSTTVSRNEIFLYPSICILETTKILWISISVYQTLVYFLLNVLNLGHTCQQNFNNTYNDCQTKEYIVKCLQMTELSIYIQIEYIRTFTCSCVFVSTEERKQIQVSHEVKLPWLAYGSILGDKEYEDREEKYQNGKYLY